MNDSMTSRGVRATLFAFSGALLLALAACNNGYGPPSPDQASLTWGQQHYLDNQHYTALHLDGRADSAGQSARGAQ